MIRAIFGITGSGKTTLSRHLTRESARVMIYDAHAEHDAVLCEPADFLPYLELVAERPAFRVAVTPMIGLYGLEFGAAAWAVGKRGPVLAVIEELDTIAPVERIPITIRRLLAQGRHVNVDLQGTSQRPAQVNRLITSQARELYAFHTHEPRDVEYIASYIGASAAELPTLPEFQFLAWSAGGGIRRGRVDPHGYALEPPVGIAQASSGSHEGETASARGIPP